MWFKSYEQLYLLTTTSRTDAQKYLVFKYILLHMPVVR